MGYCYYYYYSLSLLPGNWSWIYSRTARGGQLPPMTLAWPPAVPCKMFEVSSEVTNFMTDFVGLHQLFIDFP